MKRAQWVLLAFLTFLNVLNFVDRQLIPSLAPKLMADLGLNRAEIGLLYGYVFIVFYTAVGLWLGTVADRWHRPRLIAMGLGLWSALTAVTGAALNFSHLALARIFIGIGEAAAPGRRGKSLSGPLTTCRAGDIVAERFVDPFRRAPRYGPSSSGGNCHATIKYALCGFGM
jgi:MFS family permease